MIKDHPCGKGVIATEREVVGQGENLIISVINNIQSVSWMASHNYNITMDKLVQYSFNIQMCPYYTPTITYNPTIMLCMYTYVWVQYIVHVQIPITL